MGLITYESARDFVFKKMDEFLKLNPRYRPEDIKRHVLPKESLIEAWETEFGGKTNKHADANFRKYMSEWRKKKKEQQVIEDLKTQIENGKKDKIIELTQVFLKNHEEEIKNTKFLHFMKDSAIEMNPEQLLKGETFLEVDQLKRAFTKFEVFWKKYGVILDTGVKFEDYESIEAIESDIYASIHNNPDLNLSITDIEKIEAEKELSEREAKMSIEDWKEKILSTGISKEELKSQIKRVISSVDNLMSEESAIIFIKSEMKLTPN